MDIVALRAMPAALMAIKTFLGRSDIIKVVIDGRTDAIELFDLLRLQLDNVLDLQIADVLAHRTVHDEDDRQHITRLAKFRFGSRTARANKEMMMELDVVKGMQRLLKDFGLYQNIHKDAEVVAMHKKLGSEFWMARPLSEKLLRYAANDIVMIAYLFAAFQRRGYIPSTTEDAGKLIAMSNQYVSRNCNRGWRLAQDNVFNPKNLLMVAALQPPQGRSFECDGCGLVFVISCYEVRTNALGGRERKAHCRVCDAIILESKNTISPEVVWVGLR
ncbi:hypothetical protein EVG20_g6818 [Dentipellis fragilis]|uniref:3'-5' exonuclease domain-containing protein n=1 Tax=Dentipellis fragilis TaxID=205917 RepID=A0A4Y9YJF6_9AGAM|nr:hypothetical protein EVG20_g6818 [Dentipellis fragilis]